MPRFNLYSFIHRAVRGVLADCMVLAGKTDFTNDQSVQVLSDRFNIIRQFLIEHSEHEDHFVHPLLEQKSVYPKLAELTQTHHHLDALVDEVCRTLNTFRTKFFQDTKNLSIPSTIDDAREQGYRLYLQLARLNANYGLHLLEEECEIMPHLWKNYSDEELFLVQRSIQKQMSAEKLKRDIPLIFCYLSASDAMMAVKGMQMEYKNEFPELWDLISQAMGEGEELSKLSILIFGEVELKSSYDLSPGKLLAQSGGIYQKQPYSPKHKTNHEHACTIYAEEEKNLI